NNMALLRESIAKQSLMEAKEICNQTSDHKALIKKFIQTYESDLCDDVKYGKKKYQAMLQEAVNNRIGTIVIDLDDVEQFCKKELKEPDLHMSQSVLDLQQSIESLVSCVEGNVMRYRLFFYEVCDALQPARDGGYRAEGAAKARDAVQCWRERLSKQKEQQGGALPKDCGVPAKLKNPWDIRFKPRGTCQSIPLRQIRAESVGALIQLDCLVVNLSQVKPKVEVVTYHCETCGSEIFQSVEGENYTPPKECPSQKCRDNKQSGNLRCNIRTSAFTKHQEMKVQEMSDHVPQGGVPRSISVLLEGDLTRQVLAGDAITLTGVYYPHSLPYFQKMKMRTPTTQRMFIEAHHIQKHKKGYSETAVDEDVMEHKIQEALQHSGDRLYEHAAKSIAPEIFGHEDVKKALLLVLIGSYTKQMQDGLKIRGDIHTLMMGDPGVAKSQLLKQVCAIAPRSVYTTGKGSTGVGLTATVNRDNATGEVTLEGGSLVLADMGVCCIDEFDKMEEGDRTAIHEVMEQQTVSIAKAGITTTLNCRTTILAAANPVYGRYNPYKSPVENIDLPAALLSRFDLVFLLLDTVDCDKDKQLAEHVTKVHSAYEKKEIEGGMELEDSDVLGLGFKPYNHKFMRAFVRKARSYEPVLDDALRNDIADAYVAMRDDEKRDGIQEKKSYTTPRTLLAIMRLSQAHARARFSNRVERQDFDEAMRLMKASKESIELSAPAKRGQNPLDVIYEILADLSRRDSVKDGWVDVTHVVSMAGHKALTKELVMEGIESWQSLGVVTMNPEKTMVQFLVPVE
ncbi:DNA replication licensing factor MCM7 (Minichromosome maintenance protein 7) (OsMCM7), partial [Durusdinium trenchii]